VELRDYLRVARRQWWVVALSVLVAVGVAMVLTARTKPVYAATVTFFVSAEKILGGSALEGSMFTQTRLNTYDALLTGDRLAKSIAASTDTGLDPKEIQERIKVVTDQSTVLIDVTVTDGSPARAKLLADQLSVHFQALVRELEERPSDKVPIATVRPLEPPQLVAEPVEPRPMHNAALGVAVGLILGAALAVARELADTSVRSDAQLSDLAAVPVLARIPVDRRARRRAGPFVSDSRSPRAEALRQLRTNVQYADRERPVKTLAVTSAVGGEGRSATACGLAILFAEAGQRVLIVDAELRRPRLAAFLGREGTAGLTTVLLGGASLDQVLQPWGTGLWLLSSGHQPPNPSELLGSQRMADLLDELRGRFDMVIVDSPPLLPVTDGAVVAARTDGALLIVRSRRTTTAQVTAAVRALHAVDARLTGCVVNMVTAKRSSRLARLIGRRKSAKNAPHWWAAAAVPC
jgi:capsular exopolysaccharide synthesis family protein